MSDLSHEFPSLNGHGFSQDTDLTTTKIVQSIDLQETSDVTKDVISQHMLGFPSLHLCSDKKENVVLEGTNQIPNFSPYISYRGSR